MLMCCHRALQIQTSLREEQLLERLEKAVFPAAHLSGLRALPVSGLLRDIDDQWFIGRLDGTHFKLILRSRMENRLIIQRGQVVIIGNIEGSTLHITLRPPFFSAIFAVLWCAVVAAGLGLALLGPVHPWYVVAFLVLALILPPAILIPGFKQEAGIVCETLNRIFGVQAC